MNAESAQYPSVSSHPYISPYRSIHPFRYMDHRYFFGREEVVEGLLAKMILYRVVLLFGESGTGKSSVINAGLIPALEKKGFLSERLRVRPFPDEPILIERIPTGSEESQFLPSNFCQETTPEKVIPCSLEKFIDIIHLKARTTYPVLMFDQFEEFFTLFSPKEPIGPAGQDLQNKILEVIFRIANDQALKAKILIIIRDDFLGKLEVLSKRYPQIFANYLRIEKMEIPDAKRAILGPFENKNPFPSRLTEKLAEVIIQDLSQSDPGNKLHPTQLQIICSRLWDRYYSSKPEITEAVFKESGGVKGILEGFLRTELGKFGYAQRAKAIMVLGHLITESGTRDVVSEEKLKSLIVPKKEKEKEIFSQALHILEEQRIINRTSQRETYYYEIASEYLIESIQKEKHRFSQLQEKKLLYKRLLKFALLGLAGSIFMFSFYYITAYWPENRPWGYLKNLTTGKVHYLKGDGISIGRATKEIKNTINLLPQTISRLHLIINHDLFATDLRSLNGTSINAELTPYGKSQKLKDRDIIVLAGLAPFEFHTIKYSPLQLWTPSIKESSSPYGWGMLIDGRSREVKYLTGSIYFLSLNEKNQIILREEKTDDFLLVIRRHDDGTVTIEDREDNVDLIATMKEGDYDYPRYRVLPGKEHPDLRTKRESHDLFEVTYSYKDIPFQIVPIIPDLEARP